MSEKECYEIRMQLESYEDIFSDFDSRPFNERALSDDFLLETKKASLDKGEKMDILFFLAKEKRNTNDETTIKKRLLAHFKRHSLLLQQEQKKVVKTGIFFTATGIILMFLATFFLFRYENNFIASLVIIILEPSSWFLFWEGLTLLIFTSKKKQPERVFYEKISHAHIFFKSKTP